MKRFFLLLSLMGALLGLTAWGLWALADRGIATSTNGWAAIAEKHRQVKTVANTLWLVGGSNVMFGYDSDQLSQALHRPVRNMGLGAALGLPFMLNEAQAIAKPGDVVVLSLEYNLREGNYDVLHQAAEFYPPAGSFIEYPSAMVWLKTKAHHQLRKARSGINSLLYKTTTMPSIADTVNVYFRDAFSERGDLISQLNNPNPVHIDFANQLHYVSYVDQISRINRFIAEEKQRGVTVYFTYPPIAQTTYRASLTACRHWQQELKSQLKAPIITQPDSTVYPDSLFFDTIYHLNGPGRNRHTQTLLTGLRPLCQL